jgi:predicted ATPase/DNA-binding winged helix-turn-helix (wHTH) protein
LHHRFEGFELLEQERQLYVGQTRAVVGGRAFDTLLALVQHHDRVVSKAELLDRVWPGQAVEEGNLQVQISSLRKVLGREVIATVPGRGYRLARRPLPREGVLPPANSASPPATVPATDAADRRWTNLPLRLPSLYGRDADLTRLRTLLSRHALVSVVATSGVGKTQLARTAASIAREQFPDGVWCVELAQLEQADLIAPELVRTLGFQVPAGRTPTEMAIGLLRHRRALLLLDNCEHLLEPAARLVHDILTAAPRVGVLVTSQRPLKLPGERVYRLGTLALPDVPGAEAARHSGAVQLLVSRVQALMPSFALRDDNVDRIVSLCRRLDGIPLALEFAAARVPVLGIDGLLARLDERFRVLGVTGLPGLQRHQTLQAALAFSHGLLSADEQTVFRRLGAFAGSFSIDAAQDVASDASIDRWAVLDHVSALVDKSLVLAEGDDPPRLRLLESPRLFALQRLAEAGEMHRGQERHARVTAAMIARSAEDYWEASDAELRRRYGQEHANLRAAFAWALVHDAALAIEMAGNACALWREALGVQPEGARCCEAALALVTEHTPPLAAGRLFYTLGWMLIWSQQQRGRAAAHRAAPLLRQAGDQATLAMTLLLQIPGTTAPDARQSEVAAELEGLLDARSQPRMQAACVSGIARYAMGQRRHAEASRRYAEARALLARCGAVQWEGVLAWTMAGIAMASGELDFAADTLQSTAARLAAEPTQGIFLAFCLGSLATAELLRGSPGAARVALGQAAPLIGHYNIGSRYADTAAWLAATEGRWIAAARLLGYSRAAAAASGVDAEEPAEVMARERAQAALAAARPSAFLSSWVDDGAALSTEAAYRLALADG